MKNFASQTLSHFNSTKTEKNEQKKRKNSETISSIEHKNSFHAISLTSVAERIRLSLAFFIHFGLKKTCFLVNVSARGKGKFNYLRGKFSFAILSYMKGE